MQPDRYASASAHIDVVLYPGALWGPALGLIDLLHKANAVSRLQHGASAAWIGWCLVDEDRRAIDALPLPLRHYAKTQNRAGGEASSRRAVFVPPLQVQDVPTLRAAAKRLDKLTRWLARAGTGGELIITLDNAAWLLYTGGHLPPGRLALPWSYVAAFAGDFPQAIVVPGRAWLHDGALLSGAEMETLVALAVELIRLAAGDALAQACSNAWRHAPDRQIAAANAAAQHHIGTTRDSTVARAVGWMERHLDRPYRLNEVAAAAAASPRTLMRHFQAVLGHSPLDHLHQLRHRRAQVLLEITLDAIPTVAQACGYSDPAAFRRMFKRLAGMSPTQYRERHALRAPRARWRTETR